MSLTPALRSFTSRLPNIGVGLGSLVASFMLPFWPWLGSLVSAIALLWLRYHMEGIEKDKQRQHEASEHEKDRQRDASKLGHEEKKWQYDAQEREKEREHEVKKWKHDKEAARINALARTTSSTSVMAVA